MTWLTKYLKFWVFAVISGLLTVWLAAEIVGYNPLDDRYSLTAQFEDATGLRAGNPVRLAGVPIGQVTSVRLESGHAVVRFEVDSDVDLPKDTVVAVRSQNVIGMRELVLEPGTDPAVWRDVASADRRIGFDDPTLTRNSIELGNLINEFGPLLEAVNPERLNELGEVLTDTLAGNRESIHNITTDFSTIADRLAGQSGTIVQLIDDYETILAEVGRRDRQIQQLIDNIVLLSETFAASEDVLVDALAELPDFSTRLAALLQANAGNLDSIVGDLAILTDTVVDNLGAVIDLVDVAPAGLHKAIDVSGQGDYLNVNFQCVSPSPPPCPHPITDAPNTGFDDLLRQILDLLR